MKAIGFIAIIALWLAAISGWCMNLYQVIVMAIASAPITTLFVAKFVGIFAFPLGAVLGWV